MDGADLGERIRRARVSRGMTQAELAALVGVTRSAVAQWETGRAGQVTGNLARIADALGLPVDRLIGREPEATEATNATELAMLRLWRECDEDDRQLLLQTALRLARARAGRRPGGQSA
jgi:transcriptional regulator with XRE-family HTH domain